ncbi:MAG: hypothetical protein JNK05_13365 [Myxococcales bacterium]|nr:hypothetical protein [Myxococcales bacterium]
MSDRTAEPREVSFLEDYQVTHVTESDAVRNVVQPWIAKKFGHATATIELVGGFFDAVRAYVEPPAKKPSAKDPTGQNAKRTAEKAAAWRAEPIVLWCCLGGTDLQIDDPHDSRPSEETLRTMVVFARAHGGVDDERLPVLMTTLAINEAQLPRVEDANRAIDELLYQRQDLVKLGRSQRLSNVLDHAGMGLLLHLELQHSNALADLVNVITREDKRVRNDLNAIHEAWKGRLSTEQTEREILRALRLMLMKLPVEHLRTTKATMLSEHHLKHRFTRLRMLVRRELLFAAGPRIETIPNKRRRDSFRLSLKVVSGISITGAALLCAARAEAAVGAAIVLLILAVLLALKQCAPHAPQAEALTTEQAAAADAQRPTPNDTVARNPIGESSEAGPLADGMLAQTTAESQDRDAADASTTALAPSRARDSEADWDHFQGPSNLRVAVRGDSFRQINDQLQLRFYVNGQLRAFLHDRPYCDGARAADTIAMICQEDTLFVGRMIEGRVLFGLAYQRHPVRTETGTFHAWITHGRWAADADPEAVREHPETSLATRCQPSDFDWIAGIDAPTIVTTLCERFRFSTVCQLPFHTLNVTSSVAADRSFMVWASVDPTWTDDVRIVLRGRSRRSSGEASEFVTADCSETTCTLTLPAGMPDITFLGASSSRAHFLPAMNYVPRPEAAMTIDAIRACVLRQLAAQ